MKYLWAAIVVLFASVSLAEDVTVAEYLQNISVTVKSGTSEGSGVIITRGKTNFVLTAGHVIDSLRRTRSVIDPKTGAERNVVEFDDAQIVQNIYQNGRKVGQLEMSAKVLCYSNADFGEDLALLRVLKDDFIRDTAQFYLKSEPPRIGSDLYHVGSLRGQVGSNSLTTGIISQTGRIMNGVLYDQTNCTAFPGSSGGGIFLRESGVYIGMLVRSGGEGFNFYVPIRRIEKWAKRMNIEFVLNADLDVPDEAELNRIPIEDVGERNWERLQFKNNEGPNESPMFPEPSCEAAESEFSSLEYSLVAE